jgi:hypothetical protein
MVMDDNRDIAFLAASCEREMKQTLAGSGLKYNRTDFRRFLGNGGNSFPQQQSAPYPQHYNPQQYHQPPQQQQYYQQQVAPAYNNIPVEPNIPDGVLPPPNATFIPMPNGYGQQVPAQQPLTTNLESVGGFEMPDYNRASKTYLEDEKQFRDALILEIKALKNNVKAQKTQLNKLTKAVESLTLLLSKEQPQQETEIIDDNPDQS